MRTTGRQIGVEVSGKDVLPMIDELTQGVVARCLGRPEKETVTLEDEIPGRPPVMCAGCPHRGVFYTLSKNKCMVYGDIGCYTLGVMPPLNAMDLNVCMGPPAPVCTALIWPAARPTRRTAWP